ncbi:hypothetical protein [Deinococcus aquatilis]|uniref:hypothetical protein n=1 Tax=Deinococcus aquatilis TaxID=519440 RepID=UPI00037BBC6E|nr:hypothetical protein [Deinococcus aquatilis]
MSRDNTPTPTVQAIGELHLEGNIIPHSFFTRREFKSDYGITQHIAIMIYADDLYWYRPTYHRDELTGKLLKTTRKFEADKLQRTYDYYAGLFGVSKQQATDAVKFLVDRGLITREFRTIRLADGRKASNVMYVEPVVEALKVLLQADERGGDGWFWVAEPPKPNVKKTKDGEGEGIPNKRDTYPEHSRYVSDLSGRRIRNTRDTNTETSTEISSKTSPKNSSSTSGPPQAVTVTVQDDDDFSAGAEPHGTPPTVEGSEGLPLTGKKSAEMEGGETESKIPALETIPGGAALLALAPIPRQVLEARSARDPLEMKSLRALLFCSNKSRIGELHTRLSLPTSVKGIPRELFTRLTDDEIGQAITAARLDVSLTTGGFERLAVLGLDRLIGEPLTLAMIKGEAESRSALAPQGRAYDVKNDPARASTTQQSTEPVEDAPRVDFAKYLGLWELKANPNQVVDVVQVQERPGSTPLLHLKTEDTLTVTDITLKYRRPPYAAG